jgi:hypothetical protein
MKASKSFQLASHLALGLFLVIMLATNGVAEAQGPVTWFAFVRLPDRGGNWVRLGPVLLLPLISVVCWLVYRWEAAGVPRWQWGWLGITLPIAALGLLALLSLGWQCVQQVCNLAAALRLLLLLALFWWVYLFILNERPNLLWTLVVIVALQSLVAIGQFLLQHDLGLQLLGEWELDPLKNGISIVIHNGQRWLRGYGLTRHPNTLSQTLILCLLLLLALAPVKLDRRPTTDDRSLEYCGRPSSVGRRLIPAVCVLGLGGVFVTLSRWSWVCLAIGLLIHALPFLRRFIRERSLPPVPQSVYWSILAVTLVLALSGFLYGGAVLGRFLDLSNPIESRSLWERERDVAISLALIREHPWTGVGFGNYLAQAVRRDWWAEPVHSVPLQIGTELGLPGLALWLLLIAAPLLPYNARTNDTAWTDPSAMAVFLAFGLSGLMQPGPNPLVEVRSALFAGVVLSICPSIFSRV